MQSIPTLDAIDPQLDLKFLQYLNKTIRNQIKGVHLLVMMQEKTFFLENQENNKSQIIAWEIPRSGHYVNLEKLIAKIPEPHKKVFKIYNAEKDDYVPFNNKNFHFESTQPYTISRQLLSSSVIIIKYSHNSESIESDQAHSQSQDNKKQRSRERNIKEVIQLIQKWREYHENPPDGKKKTLQQAAKYVGVSKKSLDDYYYQLRVGEKHNFDFNAHLEEKIGVLRAFIKVHQPDRRVEGKNAKHPKKLKIIQQYAQKLKITQQNSNQNYNPHHFQFTKIEQQPRPVEIIKNISQNNSNSNIDNLFVFDNEDQLFWGSPFSPLSQEKFVDVERNFYQDFQFNLQDPGDPYLPFTNMMTKKSNKSNNQDSI